MKEGSDRSSFSPLSLPRKSLWFPAEILLCGGKVSSQPVSLINISLWWGGKKKKKKNGIPLLYFFLINQTCILKIKRCLEIISATYFFF